MLGCLQRRGVVQLDDGALCVDDELAAVSGLATAGPELGHRPVAVVEGPGSVLIDVRGLELSQCAAHRWDDRRRPALALEQLAAANLRRGTAAG